MNRAESCSVRGGGNGMRRRPPGACEGSCRLPGAPSYMSARMLPASAYWDSAEGVRGV